MSTGNDSQHNSRIPLIATEATRTASHDSTDDARQGRLADLIAGGAMAFPNNLSVEQTELLVDEVSRRRTARLVRFLADAIARSIWSDQAGEKDEGPVR